MHREFVEVGGLLSFGVNFGDVLRRMANMTADVLKGAKPADIPYYQQTNFELVLNRTTARSLGLEFPPSLLAVADEVIEIGCNPLHFRCRFLARLRHADSSSNVRVRGRSGKHMLARSSSQFDPCATVAGDASGHLHSARGTVA
jgi:ABC transporter substrate binding protein